MVWACGPLTGGPVERVHERFLGGAGVLDERLAWCTSPAGRAAAAAARDEAHAAGAGQLDALTAALQA